jgi:hypothetical protein
MRGRAVRAAKKKNDVSIFMLYVPRTTCIYTLFPFCCLQIADCSPEPQKRNDFSPTQALGLRLALRKYLCVFLGPRIRMQQGASKKKTRPVAFSGIAIFWPILLRVILTLDTTCEAPAAL